jgi:hypothetical protein
MKNDKTPAYNNKMKRLAVVGKHEKEKPENAGKTVVFNQKTEKRSR